MKTTTQLVLSFIILRLVAVTPTIQAVVPPPDGGYPGFNTAEGQKALFGLTTGTGNVAVGWGSLFSDTVGSFNTAIGTGALLLNTADQNTATGAGALLFNNSGDNNTANGAFALHLNTTGFQNTANGVKALFNNTSGSGNVADGYLALFHNTTGGINTASGWQALYSNTEGNSNTATGVNVLYNNTTGYSNTASGDGALFYNSTGALNTATGVLSLNSNTDGDENTAIGNAALFNNTIGGGNTAIGDRALLNNTSGNGNTSLGSFAGTLVTTAHNVICIGSLGGNVNNSCFIGYIRGVTTQNADAIPVLVDSAGQLGTLSSSRRFKNEIKPMDCASEAIHALKPVMFSYKSDKTNTPQFGLIAEEVAEVNPNLVVRDEKGDIYTVRYDAVNAMLLNEFLKEHRKVHNDYCKLNKQSHVLLRETKSSSANSESQRPTRTEPNGSADCSQQSVRLPDGEVLEIFADTYRKRRLTRARHLRNCASRWKHFIPRADEMLTAFLELGSAGGACGDLCLTSRRHFLQTRRRYTDLNQAEDISPLGSSPLPDPQ